MRKIDWLLEHGLLDDAANFRTRTGTKVHTGQVRVYTGGPNVGQMFVTSVCSLYGVLAADVDWTDETATCYICKPSPEGTPS
jgi:hypothetical protein